jgi:hypothetical protein
VNTRPRASIVKLRPDVLAKIARHRLPREPDLPEAQLGHCMVCGAGFREHIACETGNCHFVRTIEEDASSERRAMVDQEKERNAALILRSRNWLERYMARPRKTAFNWCPSIVFKEFKEPNRYGSNKEPSEGAQEEKC